MSKPDVIDEIAPPARRRFRWLRWSIAILAIAFLASLLFYINSRQSAEEELAELIAGLDRDDPGWRFEDIQAKRTTPREEENAAQAVMMFRLALPYQSTTLLQPLEELQKLAPGTPLSAEQRRNLWYAMSRLRNGTSAARKLNRLDAGRFPIEHQKVFLSTLLPDSQACRTAADLLWFDALLRLQVGDLRGAAENVHGMLSAARAHGDEPIVTCQVIRIGVRRRAVRALEYLLSRGELGGLDEAALARFQERFAAEENENLLLIMARGERALADRFFQALADGDSETHRTLLKLLEMERGNHERWEEAAYWLDGPASRDHVVALRRLTQFADAARAPVEEQIARLQRLDGAGGKQPLLARKLFAYPLAPIGESYLRSRVELRAAAAGLAAERFRLRHGRWPERLDELVPEFLAEPPADPFSRMPFKMARTERGIVIYSIGPNGVDDGGQLSRAEQQTTTKPTGDLGFELLDAARRN